MQTFIYLITVTSIYQTLTYLITVSIIYQILIYLITVIITYQTLIYLITVTIIDQTLIYLITVTITYQTLIYIITITITVTITSLLQTPTEGDTAASTHLPPLVGAADLTADDSGVRPVPQVTTHSAPRLVVEPPHLHPPLPAPRPPHQSQLQV